MKTIVFLGSVLLVVLVPLTTGISQTTAPTISDLQIAGAENIKADKPCTIVYNIKSNQQPDEVTVNAYIATPYFTRRSVYSSKKGELHVAVVEKEGVYEIAANRDPSAFPAIIGGSTMEVEVWITSGGKSSNKLKGNIHLNF